MKKRPTIEEIVARYQPDVTAPVKEVMDQVHQAVLATPAFTLKDGRTAKVENYFPPEADDEGELSCGFDVVLDDGTHLEFSIKNTGWGKSFATAHAPKKPRPGRRR